MTVTAYLFDYTLNVLCGGNRSECARRLEIRRPDFNRMQQRIQDGGVSVRAIESILILFWRENLSLDQVLKGYINKHPDLLSSHEQEPEFAVKLLRDEMANEWKNAHSRMSLFKAADTFMAQLEHAFCSEKCSSLHKCAIDCPCKKFAAYIEWMKNKLDQINEISQN